MSAGVEHGFIGNPFADFRRPIAGEVSTVGVFFGQDLVEALRGIVPFNATCARMNFRGEAVSGRVASGPPLWWPGIVMGAGVYYGK